MSAENPTNDCLAMCDVVAVQQKLHHGGHGPFKGSLEGLENLLVRLWDVTRFLDLSGQTHYQGQVDGDADGVVGGGHNGTGAYSGVNVDLFEQEWQGQAKGG
jgi:hypothetical protein